MTNLAEKARIDVCHVIINKACLYLFLIIFSAIFCFKFGYSFVCILRDQKEKNFFFENGTYDLWSCQGMKCELTDIQV